MSDRNAMCVFVCRWTHCVHHICLPDISRRHTMIIIIIIKVARRPIDVLLCNLQLIWVLWCARTRPAIWLLADRREWVSSGAPSCPQPHIYIDMWVYVSTLWIYSKPHECKQRRVWCIWWRMSSSQRLILLCLRQEVIVIFMGSRTSCANITQGLYLLLISVL